MIRSVDTYRLTDPGNVLTPALLIYPEQVRANVESAIRLMGGDASRWRPHVKTVKSPQVIRMLIESGVRATKVSTTLELLMCCEEGMPDVLFAMPVAPRTAERIRDIAAAFPNTRVSTLAESEDQFAGLDLFIDINPGMNRTGLLPGRIDEIRRLAHLAGDRFRGLHFYDGHLSPDDVKQAQAGYAELLHIVEGLGMPVGELITSGTPASRAALAFEPFRNAAFQHRVSPGTVVFNDLNSLRQLPDVGFTPAALVMATVVSHPSPNIVTCDAGHKSVSVDSGVPNCAVLGRPELEPLKPSEEHLPIRVPPGAAIPALGEQLYLLPKHICPTVNMFDEALAVQSGQIVDTWPIRARGHEFFPVRVSREPAESPAR